MVAVNIRGTSGSGKSTLVRNVMALYQAKAPVYVDGRKQPEAYLLSSEGHRCLYVPGHYETPCGGCDTIKTPERVYEMVREAVRAGCDVLYEGIMVMDDVRRAVALSLNTELHVVALSTSLEVCLMGVAARRAARGDLRPLDAKNTIDRARRCEAGLRRLEAEHVPVYRLDRAQALSKVCSLLSLS